MQAYHLLSTKIKNHTSVQNGPNWDSHAGVSIVLYMLTPMLSNGKTKVPCFVGNISLPTLK